jgi:phage tail-like protein
MSRPLLTGYRFATAAQWNTCLFEAADREGGDSFRPFAPYAGPPTRFASAGGFAPAFSRGFELLWRDAKGKLWRLPFAEDDPHAATAPAAIAETTRLVAGTETIWAIAADGSLQGFDLGGLSRRFVIEIPYSRVVDIADDRKGGVFVLLQRPSSWEIAHVSCMGSLEPGFVVKGVTSPAQLAYLARADRLVVLSQSPAKLFWFARTGGDPTYSLPVSAVRPCFNPTAFGSDGRARLLIAGIDGVPFGGQPQALSLDSEGNVLGVLALDASATGIVGNRSQLLITTEAGLLRFATAATVPEEAIEVRASMMTPMLRTSSTDDLRRWLRVEVKATVPAGAALEIAYGSAPDIETRNEMQRIAGDYAMPAGQRLERMRTRLGSWRTISFFGDVSGEADRAVNLAAPLFDVREEYLWISVALVAAPGGCIPDLSELAVLYPGQTLMENLPSIYQRAEAQPGSFLRGLVGVLETTTQSLDGRIAEMGRHIHPKTAPGPWLDFIARWLGLPWDDALSLAQKQAIVLHGPTIAGTRGTRAGMEALLESLMPETPRRFRIVDSAAEFGLVTLGGADCAGNRLPSVLYGLPTTATELGNKAILGQARLPCPGDGCDIGRHVGQIRVDIGATAGERAQWQPWLRRLIEEIVPATVRIRLRWLSPATFEQDGRLGETLRLADAPEPHLGTDAVTGIARLPDRDGISLSGPGADGGSPLH